MTVSVLLNQPCNKSDSPIVNNSLQTCRNILGARSADTTCQQFVNRAIKTCAFFHAFNIRFLRRPKIANFKFNFEDY